jgi:methionyl aminopeptidase
MLVKLAAMDEAKSQPVARAPAQLPGANQPCWCGSGEKYKKCHRASDEAQAALQGGGPVRPGAISPMRAVPPHIARPEYAETGRPGRVAPLEPAERLRRMRIACRAAAEVLIETAKQVKPGVTTDALDAVAHAAYLARGGYPSTLNYHGFPKSLCTSVNEVICHGIPDSRALEDGDLVNLDISVFVNGVHGDCSATYAVGALDGESQRLVRVAEECLYLGIETVKPGMPINVIGRAIEAHARRHGFGVVRSYCGHGIGEQFHTPLQIPHYFDPKATTIMDEGLIFTIEPMLTAGTHRHIDWDDGWTVATADGKRSAQFEHTIVVTATGAEVLTKAD